jgi:hypothetical protein
MVPNPKLKGFRRDSLIIDLIESRKCLSTDQVRSLLFSDLAEGRRKAQERLKVLRDRGALQRSKVDGEYCYWVAGEKKPGQIKHRLAVNWCRIWMERTCPPGYVVHSWEYEPNYIELRPDGLMSIKNGTRWQFAFLEVDRATNPFEPKVQKYRKYFNEEKYSGLWWAQLAARFPPVVVVTISLARKKQIEEVVSKEEIEFKVYLLEEILEEVRRACTGNR